MDRLAVLEDSRILEKSPRFGANIISELECGRNLPNNALSLRKVDANSTEQYLAVSLRGLATRSVSPSL
jgi:hypothetical protein